MPLAIADSDFLRLVQEDAPYGDIMTTGPGITTQPGRYLAQRRPRCAGHHGLAVAEAPTAR